MNDYSQLFQPTDQAQQQQTQTQTSSYPSLPNAYGLGTQQSMQQPQVPQMQQNPQQGTQGSQQQPQQMMTDSSRGFNPWSLGNGESGAR